MLDYGYTDFISNFVEKILNNISFGFHAKDYSGLITSDYSTSRGKISDVLIKSAGKLGNKEKGSKGLASVKKYSRGRCLGLAPNYP